MQTKPEVSVLISTLNRADALRSTLRSLRQLTYPNFEVVVVVGPCTDQTLDVVADYEGDIKILHCPVANLSKSRNIGVGAAAGEIVAFLDDDGIPEPTWIDELVALYDGEDVAGTGGPVRDHTGYTFQCRFNSSDRLGNASLEHDLPLEDWCAPGVARFPYLIGTNSSFRRDILFQVGGFDEEIEFYLDETDVCLRMVDAGYVLRQGMRPEVHHKFLPSAIRNSERVTVDLFAVVKNRIYFSLVNGATYYGLAEIFADNAQFSQRMAKGLELHHAAGRISDSDLTHGLERIEEAWRVGTETGFRGRQGLLDPRRASAFPEFLPFLTWRTTGRRLRIVFVSQSLPPADTAGIGRYMLDTARKLAERGHETRIITSSDRHNTVDLENGVWIHRVRKDGAQEPSTIHSRVPDRIWRNAGAVADEASRLNHQRPIDVVSGAMWDVETIAVLERSSVPVTTTLVTTMGITRRTKPEWSSDPAFMSGFLEPMLKLERWLIEKSAGVQAISHAILEEALASSGAEIEPASATVSPLGVPDHLGVPIAGRIEHDPMILFVGRFEKRKGIDLMLAMIPGLLERHPTATVTLIGRDDLPDEQGVSYRSQFEETYGSTGWIKRVCFRGVVRDEDLWPAYQAADIFVAPSRFESFGLVYVEAMMAGKPVVALESGAAPEVVIYGETGLLVPVDDVDSLLSAVSMLIDEPMMAERLGAAGRNRYEQNFTDEAMGRRAEAFFMSIVGDAQS